ncbi:ribonuclease H family protein [Peptostreptococcaceae bacterium OttesenSCG-928-C18]|nr:ribonuclease H family protein [Peptostreptococcaceae bacterium OttesenSCG-928-C18]
MAKKYYYAVKVGRTSGIFYNWADCEKQVAGYSGAVYKKFDSLEEASNFVESTEGYKKEIVSKKNKEKEEDWVFYVGESEGVAYVDGSYNIATKECGYGVVLFSEVKGKETFSRKVDIQKFSEHRNVTGEVFGALFAIEKAIEYGLKKVYIHYDYTGISNWALGNWKRNNDLTKFYKARYDKLKTQIEIEFTKVDAHTGDKYNEEADMLAKESVGV